MKVPRHLAVMALLAAAAVPLDAQRQGQVEIGVHGRWAELDDRVGLDGGFGPGGRLGVFLANWFALEAEFEQIRMDREAAAGGPPAGEYDYTPLYLRGSFNFPFGARSALIAGIGYSRQDYDFETRDAGSALLGVRLGIHRNVALRVDGIADYAPSSEDWNYGARAGLSLMLGGREAGQPTVADRGEGLDFAPARADTAIAAAARDTVSRQPPVMRDTVVRQMLPADTSVNQPPTPRDTSAVPAPVARDTVVRPSPVPPDTLPMPMPPQLQPEPARPPRAGIAGEPAVEAAALRARLEERIHFGFDQSQLTQEAQLQLEQKLALIQANPEVRIRIEGHTDSRGSDEYNQALGERRADAVREWLVERGVSRDRMETVTFGEERPLCTQDTDECHGQNRRSQFVIIAGGDELTPPR